MVISCLLCNWNRKIKPEQIHHNGWNKCRSCCWGRTDQQFSFKHCHQYRAVQVLQGGNWAILQWAVTGYLSLSVGERSCSRQTMVMLVLLKMVSSHRGQLSCSLCSDVWWLLIMLCDQPWQRPSAGFWSESERRWDKQEASHHLLQEIQSSATLLSKAPTAISWTAAPCHEMWLCGVAWLGKR